MESRRQFDAATPTSPEARLELFSFRPAPADSVVVNATPRSDAALRAENAELMREKAQCLRTLAEHSQRIIDLMRENAELRRIALEALQRDRRSYPADGLPALSAAPDIVRVRALSDEETIAPLRPAPLPVQASPGLGAAWKAVAGELAEAGGGDIAHLIANATGTQGGALAASGEALVRALFGHLSRAPLPTLPVDALERFACGVLGPSAALIRPGVGEAFDYRSHQDYTERSAGPRNRIREVLCPGVRVGESVLVRAAVRT